MYSLIYRIQNFDRYSLSYEKTAVNRILQLYRAKVAKNAVKYPVEKAFGNKDKYTELKDNFKAE